VQANVLFFDANPAQEAAWTSKFWVYDPRTNMHFTLKTKPLKRSDLDEFVECFNSGNRHKRKRTWTEKRNPEGRWRSFDYEELIKRDKVNLDIFWLKDKSLGTLRHSLRHIRLLNLRLDSTVVVCPV